MKATKAAPVRVHGFVVLMVTHSPQNPKTTHLDTLNLIRQYSTMHFARLACAGIGGGLALMFATAAVLTPDSRGHGTHEQLGLPPCTFATLVGVPCPTCGMTTSWCHLMHGHGIAAMRTHASGTLLGLAAMVACVWTMAFAATGKTYIVPPRERTLFWVAGGFGLLVLVEWLVRLRGQGISLFN